MIARWPGAAQGAGMPEAMLGDLADAVRAHPWWHARAALVLDLLAREGIAPPARVLDAGCGWGVTLEALERRGYEATGLDVSGPTLELLDRERPGRRLIRADLTAEAPADAPRFDAVLALDVLEHLDDDAGAARRLLGLARPGGLLVISVPALPELWTEFDRVQGHRRRYTPESLRAALGSAGIAAARVFWWGGWLVKALKGQRSRPRGREGDPPEAVYREYLRLPMWPAAPLMRLLFRLERPRALAGKLGRGTSLFATARAG